MPPTDLKIICERCGEHIEYSSQMAGQSLQCPACQHTIKLPPPPRLSTVTRRLDKIISSTTDFAERAHRAANAPKLSMSVMLAKKFCEGFVQPRH
jgi:DNA-directed RNA polymerase subunit RPC12/RpoP